MENGSEEAMDVLENQENWDHQLSDLSDLPQSLIVTNVPLCVFRGDPDKADFESVLRPSDGSPVVFEYFKSFKRVRVTYATPQHATAARIHAHELNFKEQILRVFFAQISDDDAVEEKNDTGHLNLPPLEKQFLISPPASPPVGWAQVPEAEPVINLDLIAKLAALGKVADEAGEHEIHPGSQICPAIIVHTCDDDDDGYIQRPLFKPKIQHTRRPSLGDEEN